jgi:ATPases involved in chromosome partitioning
MTVHDTAPITAFIGATGGAGTTRTTVEIAALFAAAGEVVTVCDAAVATQGLAGYVSDRIEPDVTSLCSAPDQNEFTDAVRQVATTQTVEGQVNAVAAYSSFEQLARAQTPEAATEFEHLLTEAAQLSDRVLVDVPPLATNLAIAAVNRAEQALIVSPATIQGSIAVERTRERMRDIGSRADFVISNFGTLENAEYSLPEAATADTVEIPSSSQGSGYTDAILSVAEGIARETVTPEFGTGFLDRLGQLFSGRGT